MRQRPQPLSKGLIMKNGGSPPQLLLPYPLIISLLLLLLFSTRADEFLELKTEIEISQWSYWFMEDARVPNKAHKSIFQEPKPIRVIIGTNTWLMEGKFYRNADVMRWFTGTNIVERSIITEQLPDPPRLSNFPVGISPPAGEVRIREKPSVDGNPLRPVRVADLMDLQGNIIWLAFCSGQSLKRSGHELYPLMDLWKERCQCSGRFIDKTHLFEDELKLAKSMELFTEKGELIFQYQVRQSTNVLGWNIPLEFYLVQYGPPQYLHTNSWEVEFTAKGRVTAISSARSPSISMDTRLQPKRSGASTGSR